ncbi:MAG: cytochrome c [Rhodobacteraceae bacterium]|nr:cytochrome c [Paracoccaceae bacterium]
MQRLLAYLVALILVGLAAFWLATEPARVDPSAIAGMNGDPVRGERIFYLGGCASCHAAAGAKGDERLKLSGGLALTSPFGTFYAPNISPDAEFGIGGWSTLDLVNAMHFGTSPDGRHYYPAFPYPSYIRAELADIVDLKAFLDTLPPVAVANQAHEVGFPFNFRRLLGGWNLLFLKPGPVADASGFSAEALRGQGMAEGLGHCGECHTPRGMFGNPEYSKWLQGAPHPSGKGKIPALAGIDWSASDIAEFLKSGFTPDFDTAGAEMADVIDNTAHLGDADRAAIAAYLKEICPN